MEQAVVEYAFTPEAWHDFYVAAAGAAAALAGLLIVAMSLHLRAILGHPALRPRAVTSLFGLVAVICLSGVVLAPGVDARAVGVATAVFLVVMLITIILYAIRYRHLSARVAASTTAVAPRAGAGLLMFALTVYSTWSLLAERGGGLYVMALLVGVMVVWPVANAWNLLTAIAEE